MGTGFILLVSGAFVASVFGVAALLRRRTPSFDDEVMNSRYAGLQKLWFRSQCARVLGIAIAAVGVFAGFSLGDRWAAVSPAFVGISLVSAVMLEQRIGSTAAQVPGVASLERRSLTRYVPIELALGNVLGLAVLASILGLGVLTAGADGRSLEWACRDGADSDLISISGAGSPYPGVFYVLPVSGGILAVLILAAIALRMVVGRPRNGADPDLVRIDDAMRRSASRGILFALLFTVSATGMGVSLAGFIVSRGVVRQMAMMSAQNSGITLTGCRPELSTHVAVWGFGVGVILGLAGAVYAGICFLSLTRRGSK